MATQSKKTAKPIIQLIQEAAIHAGTNITIILAPPTQQHPRWGWSIGVDGVVGDASCQLSDGMRRIWYDGTGTDEADCRQQIRHALSIQPTSYCAIDLGYDPRSAGQTVTISRSPGAYDSVTHARWDGGEMLASTHAVARAMRKAGYRVQIED